MAKQLEGFSEDYKQVFFVAVGEQDDNYASAEINISYSMPQNYWFMDVKWSGKEKKGIRVVNAKNLLRDFRNLFPFGLMVAGGNGQDPMLTNSFLSEEEGGTHVVLVLNQEEAVRLSE